LNQYSFEQVRLLLAEPNTEIRQGLLAALRDYGFRNVATAVTPQKLNDALSGGDIDLIIGDCHYGGDVISKSIKNMRHSKLGENPFTVSIALCSEPLEKNIRTAVNAGFDDVIAKPAPVNKIVNRISKQISDRRKFVIAHSYVGPDRRKAPRPEDDPANKIPLFDVPNPLKAIAEQGKSYKMIKEEVFGERIKVKTRWLHRSAEQLDIFVQQLAAHHLHGDAPEKIPVLVKYLNEMVRELHSRLDGAHKVAASELCISMADVVGRMAKSPEAIQGKDIDLLPNLSKAIVKAFEENAAGAESIAHDITEQVLKAG